MTGLLQQNDGFPSFYRLLYSRLSSTVASEPSLTRQTVVASGNYTLYVTLILNYLVPSKRWRGLEVFYELEIELPLVTSYISEFGLGRYCKGQFQNIPEEASLHPAFCSISAKWCARNYVQQT